MGSMMIRCPGTGRPVFTGIEIERTSFNQLPEVEARLRCPLCGGEHVWTKRGAWLGLSDMAPRRRRPVAETEARGEPARGGLVTGDGEHKVSCRRPTAAAASDHARWRSASRTTA